MILLFSPAEQDTKKNLTLDQTTFIEQVATAVGDVVVTSTTTAYSSSCTFLQPGERTPTPRPLPPIESTRPTPTPTPSPTQQEEEKTKIPMGAIIGAAVGGAFLLLAGGFGLAKMLYVTSSFAVYPLCLSMSPQREQQREETEANSPIHQRKT